MVVQLGSKLQNEIHWDRLTLYLVGSTELSHRGIKTNIS